jgi:hypothetical protein
MDIRAEVVSQIARLQKVLAILDGAEGGGAVGNGRRARKPVKKRNLSAAGRARIAKAQRERWAKIRAAKK